MRCRGRHVAILTGLVGLVVAPLAVVVVMSSPAAAATSSFTVTSSADNFPGVAAHCPGPSCTLRDAFAAGDAADTAGNDVEIDIPASLSPIMLNTASLSGGSTHAWTLKGTGGTLTVTQTSATQRVIDDSTTGLFTIQNLTITGGHVSSAGGGIFASGPMTVLNSTISGNTTTGSAGGGIQANGAVTVMSSTISGNTATSDNGGAIAATSITVENSTISGNTATIGGGLSTNGAMTLVYTTVVDNTAPAAANVDVPSGTLTSFGSVIALPQPMGATNCVVGLGTTSHGFNLEDDAGHSCGFSTGTGDLAPGTNSELGAVSLVNNGGSTQTLLPPSGSPLVDAIPVGSCHPSIAAGIITDQIGTPRPQGPACDIGALEVPTALSATSGSDQVASTGGAFASPLVSTVTYSNGMPVAGDAVTCSAPGSGPSSTFSRTGTNTETDVTSENGVATTSIPIANSLVGTYGVTCTGSGTATFTLTNATLTANFTG